MAWILNDILFIIILLINLFILFIIVFTLFIIVFILFIYYLFQSTVVSTVVIDLRLYFDDR